MSRPRRIIALTGIVGTAGFTSLAAATVAGATTSQCASNPFCYTQEVHGTNLVMSVGSQWGPYSNEQVVVQKQNDRNIGRGLPGRPGTVPEDQQREVLRVRAQGPCVRLLRVRAAQPRRAGAALVQRLGQPGLGRHVERPLYEWINEATGDAMTDPGHNSSYGRAGTQLTGAHATGGRQPALGRGRQRPGLSRRGPGRSIGRARGMRSRRRRPEFRAANRRPARRSPLRVRNSVSHSV